MMHDYQDQKPTVLAILDTHLSMPGNLLPILHAIQDDLGYIPTAAVEDIASTLHLSKAEVHGVITFYHYFRETPPGQHTIHICRAESCQSMGSKALENHAKHTLGIDYHETTSDGQFSLEAVYCLGNCACSPSITIDNEVYGRVSPEKFDQLLATHQGAE
jgi:formate dehydrogenase subunit gamma